MGKLLEKGTSKWNGYRAVDIIVEKLVGEKLMLPGNPGEHFKKSI